MADEVPVLGLDVTAADVEEGVNCGCGVSSAFGVDTALLADLGMNTFALAANEARLLP